MPARQTPVAEEHERERDGDGLGEEREREEQHAGEAPAAHSRIEGAEIEDRREKGRARGEIVERLRVERMHRDHERRCRRDGEPFLAEPEMIANDAEDEQRGEPVEDEIQDVVAPRRVARDRVVEREARQEHRPQVLVLGQDRRRVGIDEEAGEVGEAPDEGILLERVPVVEVKADGEAVRVGERDHQREERGQAPARTSLRIWH